MSLRQLSGLWIVALVAMQGCGGEPSPSASDGGRCPPCADGTVCDSDQSQCVTALAEASACGRLPDGAVIEGRCVEGLTCGSVGGAQDRCSVDCGARNEATACGPGRRCFSRAPGGEGGFCGKLAGEGAACDASALVHCSGAGGARLSCITPSPALTAGRCFARCDPAAPDCGPDRSCADPFPGEPRTGLCVVPPGRYPERCDHTALSFCGAGERCIRPSLAAWGYCHQRCERAGDCPAGEDCVEPTAGLRFCVGPVPRCPMGQKAAACASCRSIEDRYCAAGDLCVQLSGDFPVCKQDCTADRTACVEGVCSRIGDEGHWACL